MHYTTVWCIVQPKNYNEQPSINLNHIPQNTPREDKMFRPPRFRPPFMSGFPTSFDPFEPRSMKPLDTLPKEEIDKLILKNAKKSNNIIHGSTALNKQLPEQLRRPTGDIDAWTSNPRQQMDKMEDKLDDAAGCDMFYERILPMTDVDGPEKNIYQVVSYRTRESVADYSSKPKKKVRTKKIEGITYEEIQHIKQKFIKILRDPRTSYSRKQKTESDLRRILAYERALKQARK